MRGWQPPSIERGIPIPDPPKPRKKRAARTYAPSPWIEFLKSLTPGDSFKTYFSTQNTVKKHADRLGIIYEYRWDGRNHHGRFWILALPWEVDYINKGLDI